MLKSYYDIVRIRLELQLVPSAQKTLCQQGQAFRQTKLWQHPDEILDRNRGRRGSSHTIEFCSYDANQTSALFTSRPRLVLDRAHPRQGYFGRIGANLEQAVPVLVYEIAF